MRKLPIIIFGIPRSGTTWLAKTLAMDQEIQYVVEPDNESTTFLGYFYKRGLQRFPYFRVGEESKNYTKLFQRALNGDYITYESPNNNLLFKSNLISLNLVKRRLKKKGSNRNIILNWDFVLKKNIQKDLNKRRLIKTVHALFNIPFLKSKFEFLPLIILRHPAACIHSHIKLGLTDGDQDVFKHSQLSEDFLQPFLGKIKKIKTPLERMGMQIGIFHHVVSQYIKQYNYKIILHEELCENPVFEFEKLFKTLDLKWDKKVEKFINDNNTKGEGFDIKRNVAQIKDEWKRVWTKEDLEEIKKGYLIFPNKFYDFE